MKPEEINKAIAEELGWHHFILNDEWGPNRALKPGQEACIGCAFTELPDFYNDLNACHEMERRMLSEKSFEFICVWLDNLYRAQGLNPWVWRNGVKDTPPMEMAGIVSATAPQRCEAFLRTIGKWKN